MPHADVHRKELALELGLGIDLKDPRLHIPAEKGCVERPLAVEYFRDGVVRAVARAVRIPENRPQTLLGTLDIRSGNAFAGMNTNPPRRRREEVDIRDEPEVPVLFPDVGAALVNLLPIRPKSPEGRNKRLALEEQAVPVEEGRREPRLILLVRRHIAVFPLARRIVRHRHDGDFLAARQRGSDQQSVFAQRNVECRPVHSPQAHFRQRPP